MAYADILDHVAGLLRYPTEGFESRFDKALAAVEAVDLEFAESFAPLARRVGELTSTEMEELYTRTFDINPLCTLEIGWQLYGEDYNRGALLVRMRSMMRSVGVVETTELPDHLVHVLPVLGRVDEDMARELAGGFVLPALRKMLDAFAEKDNPYWSLLTGLHAWIGRAFAVEEAEAGVASVRQGPYAGVPGSTDCLPMTNAEES